MSRQLLIGIGLLMLLLLTGNLALNIKQLKKFYEEQLIVRADETATTLALSISTSAKANDDAYIRSMIDVVFDRGYFKQVRFDYTRSRQNKFIARYANLGAEPDTPLWFQNWMNLQGSAAREAVSKGWFQHGYVTVELNPSFVYRQLWELVIAEFAWFLLVSILGFYGVRLLLDWQFSSLPDLLEQAQKLSENQFVKITDIPKTKELKKLVEAMNLLSGRLQNSYKAHAETVHTLNEGRYKDNLTGLLSREGWDSFLQDLMTRDGFMSGWLLLLKVRNLALLNQNHGKTQVDKLLQNIAATLQKSNVLLHENTHIARRDGSEFWVFRPDNPNSNYKKRIERLSSIVKDIPEVQSLSVELSSSASIITKVSSPSDVLYQLDLLLREGIQSNTPLIIGELQSEEATNWEQWQTRLETALQCDNILLFSQTLVAPNMTPLQKEIHCRLKVDRVEPMIAGYFWPMIETLNLAEQFDKKIISQWVEKNDVESQWAINVSGQSLNSESFRIWFETEVPETKWKNLTIECSEYALAFSDPEVESWLHALAEKGLKISVDHLGTSGESFGFLARYPLYQGKIERRYIRNIHEHKDHQLFISGMIKVLHSQNAKCYVEGVESEEEKNTLVELGVDGLMGYGLYEPVQLE